MQLHVINSAVVKLGKLMHAAKVYRGISGRVLPEQFWKANQFGVKGGVESAFMSVRRQPPKRGLPRLPDC